MRSFDFAPLHRSTVGFDQIANLMDRVMANDAPQPSYPLTISKNWTMILIVSASPSPALPKAT